MELIVAQVVAVLGKYALDRGTELLKQAGQAAADAAGELYRTVLDRLKADPAEAKTAERFEKNPDDFAKGVEAALTELVETDKAFATQLEALMTRLETSAPPGAVQMYVSGSGAAASGNAAAAGERGAAATTGGHATVYNAGPPPREPGAPDTG
jgi:hypothetical protein